MQNRLLLVLIQVSEGKFPGWHGGERTRVRPTCKGRSFDAAKIFC